MESAAKRMSIMGICNKLAWPVAPVFLAFIIGKNTTDTLISDLFLPFYIITAIFIILGIISLFAPLPEVKAAGEDSDNAEDCPYAANKRSIWEFPHLLLGALTLFFYVGVETVALGTLVDYATWLGLPDASSYAWISPVGMVIGYICGIIFIPKYLSQSNALIICSLLGIAGSLLVVLTPAPLSIWFISLMALGCSLMWPALWPLAMADLGRFTKTGASFLVMAIAGGAVIPTIYGFMKDSFGAQNSYWIALPIYIFILYYGISGYKIRTSK
jgi:fucose permease